MNYSLLFIITLYIYILTLIYTSSIYIYIYIYDCHHYIKDYANQNPLENLPESLLRKIFDYIHIVCRKYNVDIISICII